MYLLSSLISVSFVHGIHNLFATFSYTRSKSLFDLYGIMTQNFAAYIFFSVVAGWGHAKLFILFARMVVENNKMFSKSGISEQPIKMKTKAMILRWLTAKKNVL